MATAPKTKEPVQEDLLAEVDPKITENEEVELQPDQEVEIEIDSDEEEVEVKDPSEELRKQVDALRKSEEIHKKRAETYRQEAAEARQAAQQKDAEVGRSRKDILQSQFDAVSTALAASQSEAESAQRDIKTAIEAQDSSAQAEAFSRLARAQANIAKLEDGKVEIEHRLKAPEPEQPVKNAMPERIQRWLRKHPEYVQDPRKNDKIRSLHWEIIDEGHEFDSDEYIEVMETKLGLREPEEEEEVVTPAPKPKPSVQRSSNVSAPVSREAPSSPDGDRGGLVKLTLAQREAAKIAGVTEKVYAENLSKIMKMKANGTYGGQP